MIWLMRVAPWLGALIVAGLIYAKGRDDGETERDLKSARDQIVAERGVRQREAELQAQVDAAGVALSEMTAQLAAMRQADTNKRSVFYVQNPAAAAAVCLPDGRFVHHREADAAAAAALATGTGAAGVHDHPGAVPRR